MGSVSALPITERLRRSQPGRDATMSEYENLVKLCVDEVRRQWRANPCCPPLRVYFKPGDLTVIPDGVAAGDGYQIAIPELLRASVPYSHLYQWIWDRCRSVPCLTP